MSTAKTLVVASTMLLATACTTVKDLNSKMPASDQFNKNLYNEYSTLAASEADQYDWASSYNYIDKATDILNGKEVGPEMPHEYRLPKPEKYEILLSRDALMVALSPENKKKYPITAAKAQASYDCWVEQQEENWQANDIKSCRDNFYKNLRPLLGVYVAGYDEIVHFPFDSGKLGQLSKQTLSQLSKKLKNKDYKYIIVGGHTDRSGREEYNQVLSVDRAMAVKAQLMSVGVPEKKIKVVGFGERLNMVPTNDGVKNDKNRRAEIFVK